MRGTRTGCNVGPWGDYLAEVCAELAADYALDGFSFDGNYHAPMCFCPSCGRAYRAERGRALPAKADLNDVAYREYLVWRGRKLVDAHLEDAHEARTAVNGEPESDQDDDDTAGEAAVHRTARV